MSYPVIVHQRGAGAYLMLTKFASTTNGAWADLRDGDAADVSQAIVELAVRRGADRSLLQRIVDTRPKPLVDAHSAVEPHPLAHKAEIWARPDDPVEEVLVQAAELARLALDQIEAERAVDRFDAEAIGLDRVPNLPTASIEERDGRFFVYADGEHDVTHFVAPLLGELLTTDHTEPGAFSQRPLERGLYTIFFERTETGVIAASMGSHPRHESTVYKADANHVDRGPVTAEEYDDAKELWDDFADGDAVPVKSLGPGSYRMVLEHLHAAGAEFVVPGELDAGSILEVRVPHGCETPAVEAIRRLGGRRIGYADEPSLLQTRLEVAGSGVTA